MRLLIGLPTNDFIHVDFIRSLYALTDKLKADGVNFELAIESGTLVYLARERITHKAINEGFTHVLWLDSDMIFQPSVLDDLKFAQKPFVSGIYQARRPGYASCIFKTVIPGKKIERFDEYPTDTFEIQGCGFGCVLIETEILAACCRKYGTCFTPLPQLGEDIAFCQRARDLGYKIYCEPSVVCGHIGHITIYPQDHESWKRDLREMGGFDA